MGGSAGAVGMPDGAAVRDMFERLAPVYDRGNVWLSGGLDRRWRRLAAASLGAAGRVLDVACGTGDLAFAVRERLPLAEVVGVDFAEGMVSCARRKGEGKAVDFRCADVEHLPFGDGSFDGVTVGWGVRNFANRPAALAEIGRVLRCGGRVAILEAARPDGLVRRGLFGCYWALALPVLRGVMGAQGAAYGYLKESMGKMPNGDDFLAELAGAGFTELRCRRLGLGMCSLFTGVRV